MSDSPQPATRNPQPSKVSPCFEKDNFPEASISGLISLF